MFGGLNLANATSGGLMGYGMFGGGNALLPPLAAC